MASECAMLGVPSIYINRLPLMGYLKDEKDAGLLFYLHEYKEIHAKALELIESQSKKYQLLKDTFLDDKIDPTALLVWMIENYPKSKNELLTNPSIQRNFL
jgi:uncharacterized protein